VTRLTLQLQIERARKIIRSQVKTLLALEELLRTMCTRRPIESLRLATETVTIQG